jgi:glycosyltransferase involved in cell wall biosynthesis
VARICIVTISSLYSTPRVVKEADALAGAGHHVRVVYAQAGRTFSRPYDAEIAARSRWTSDAVTYNPASVAGQVWWKAMGLRQKICRRLSAVGYQGVGLAERAVGRLHPELTRLASAEIADMYIAHYPGALGAAALAARRHNAILGYDLEDCYFIQHDVGSAERIAIEAVERRYLPEVAHLSTSTRLIGEAFASHYGRSSDVEVRNCFDPLDSSDFQARGERVPACFWFSQVVSLKRGLDVVLMALARCRAPLTLDLRGTCDHDERIEIENMSRGLGLADRVRLLPPIAPDSLLAEAARYDIGFAAEAQDDPNRPLTASNKLFTYLAAGLAVASSNQPGHCEALQGIGDAARIYPFGDVDALVQILDDWALNPEQIERARAASYKAGHGDWSWRAESIKLIASVERVLAQRRNVV